MQQLNYPTKVFVDLFPDYVTFKEWYNGSGLSDNELDIPSLKTFTLIRNEYADSHIAFSEESFKQHFANDLYTYYREFEATTKGILDLMELTDEQIEVSDTMITNTADIPETELSTDTKTVDYVSNSQKMMNVKGTLQIKREQLSNKRALTTKTFLNRFKHLFIRILSPSYTYVIGEEGDL